ncbi:hypothetical protein [Mycobacterium sp. 852002-51057_SCH5723018]|uniref:hypothetical protein n=1 Tax=Mycobacterium sp. 852002-51057_SCH5723018 TaxID=1834094 RepID=UPI0009EDA953|nr:hypothetical protein [Mycobacterium sp. 852002-51057_SCH5723018]
MTTRRRRAITKGLISAAIAVGLWVGTVAPAGAAPSPDSTEPDPFAGLGCSCRETAAPGSPALKEEMARGMREGLSVWVPGLPPPPLPGQPPP